MPNALRVQSDSAQREREANLRIFLNRYLAASAATGKRPIIGPLIADLRIAGLPVSDYQIRAWAASPWGQTILDECFGDAKATAHTLLSMNLPNMLTRMIDEVLEGGPTGVSAFRALTPWFEHGDLLPKGAEAGEASAAAILLKRYKNWVKLKEEEEERTIEGESVPLELGS